MDAFALLRNLRSVGFECFVEDYELFADFRNSTDKITSVLMRKYNSVNACRTRISKARAIISAGQAKAAFKLIAASKIDSRWTEKARQYLLA